MATLTERDKDFLRLLKRSPDRGDGWRTVSAACWPLVEQFGDPAIIEADSENKQVRLSPLGRTIIGYLI